MTFADAQRWCELGLGCAVAQQALEHLFAGHRLRPMRAPALSAGRLLAALALVAGVSPGVALPAVTLLGIAMLYRFHGPYNGGSDRLCLLLAVCLTAARLWPAGTAPLVAMGYLAAQVTLSYALAGWAKLANPEWRTGTALDDVLRFSIYPADERVRELRRCRPLLAWLGRGIIVFEVAFPFAMLHSSALRVALVCAIVFHVANAVLLGLNRFVWVWLATYPALLWLQTLLPLPWNGPSAFTR